MRIVGVRVGREGAAGAVLEALVDRQDHHLAGAAEPAVHQDAGEVGLHARIGAFIFVENRFDGGRDGHWLPLNRFARLLSQARPPDKCLTWPVAREEAFTEWAEGVS